MKHLLILALALASVACNDVLYSPDATPTPAEAGAPTAPGGAATPPASPAPKPGSWMWDKKKEKGALDMGGGLNSTPDGSKTKK